MKFTASYNPPGRAHAAATCESGGQNHHVCVFCRVFLQTRKREEQKKTRGEIHNTNNVNMLGQGQTALNLHFYIECMLIMCFCLTLQNREQTHSHGGFSWQLPPLSPRHFLEQKSRKEKKTVENTNTSSRVRFLIALSACSCVVAFIFEPKRFFGRTWNY